MALNRIETIEYLETTTATMVEKIAVCGFYASLYVHVEREDFMQSRASGATAESLCKKLDSALPKLYAAVLVYSVKAKEYFIANSKLMPICIELNSC